jgi:DNA polymerase I-like protein with 3'-5' exonuclease and polymerase domains
MLVTKANFDQALLLVAAGAAKDKALGYDTETTCLNWWDTPWYDEVGVKPRVFSMQFATKEAEFYFDFNHSPDKLGDKHFEILNREITSNPETLWFIANAKFDLHHSRNHGVEFAGTVHCTKAIARVMNNLEPSLSLDALGELYLKVGKDDVVSLIKERGYVTNVKKFGYNDKFDEILHFDRLELAELVAYGKKDTRLCFDLGVHQVKRIFELDAQLFGSLPPHSSGRKILLSDVMTNEQKLTKVLFEMEREGVLIDRPYTEAAYENEVTEYRKIEGELDRLAATKVEGKVDWLSAKQLKPVFDAFNEPYSYTEKGNASFDRDALEDSESQLAKKILQYRYHYKRAHTYFENFIWLADRYNVLHADSQQAGTQFGRMSYWQPNLQNVPKRKDKDEAKYKVRRCFIPKRGTILADFDYTGAEYYLAMDYAKEMPVIEMLKAGLDPHAKLKDDMQLETRDDAKTMQFRILYGAGFAAVGKSLGHKGAAAQQIGKQKKLEYFERLPRVAAFLSQVSNVARSRGYVFNWFGRVLQYDRNTSYKAPNGVIQSGVGDMTKVAMVRIHDLLRTYKTTMLIQVHDAILFKLYPDELHLIPQIKELMCSAYPHRVLPMGADAGFSDKSWSDLTDEIPAPSLVGNA